MKFLVDVNLPPSLCGWLRARGQEAFHLADRNLLTAADAEVWDLAKAQKAVVLSKDSDFCDRALLLGPPPQVVHFDLGNCSNQILVHLLDDAFRAVRKAILVSLPAKADFRPGEARPFAAR